MYFVHVFYDGNWHPVMEDGMAHIKNKAGLKPWTTASWKEAKKMKKTQEQWGKTRIEYDGPPIGPRACAKCGGHTSPSNAAWIKTGDWATMAEFVNNEKNERQEFLVCNDCQTKILKFILTSE